MKQCSTEQTDSYKHLYSTSTVSRFSSRLFAEGLVLVTVKTGSANQGRGVHPTVDMDHDHVKMRDPIKTNVGNPTVSLISTRLLQVTIVNLRVGGKKQCRTQALGK